MIELLMTMAVILLLAGLLGFHLAGVRERARRLECMNNLRQVGLGIKQYATDNLELFPESGTNSVETHFKLISNNVQNIGKIFRCPSDFTRTGATLVTSMLATNISFGYTRGLSDGSPINVPLAFDRGVGAIPTDSSLSNFVGQSWAITSPHKVDGGNVLFSGGYIQFFGTFPDNVGMTNKVSLP